MAAAQATGSQVSDKKRVSKAVKRKAKKAVEADTDDDEDEPVVEEETKASSSAKTADVPDAAKGSEEGKPRKTKARRLEEMQAKADEEPVEPRGVMYVGHIPDGFFEPQMRKFFSQFGKVTRLRISRSKKNAKSKGYGFVEFEEESVAKIAAETMHKYLLFGKELVCQLLTKEKQHPMLWKGCKRSMRNLTNVRRKKHKAAYNDRPTVEVDGEQVPCQTTRQAARRKKSTGKLKTILANLGVEYDLDAVNEGSSQPETSAVPEDSAKGSAAAPAAARSAKKKAKKKGAA